MFTQPVRGTDFFGRAAILELLNKRVNALKAGYRQNIALTGQMRAGKSSILHHFLACLEGTELIPVYVEVEDRSFPLFANKFMATILYAFLGSENRPVVEDMEQLIKEGEKIIPKTTEAIKKIMADIAKKKYNLAYRELLEITSVLRDETHKPCVVILDEFHNLEHYRIKHPFLHLGKIIMVQKSTMYIVSSSQRNTIKKILSEKLSLLFGNFEVVEVAGFDIETARLFLREKISPMTISDYYIDYILNLTEKNPFYLDIIGIALKMTGQKSHILRVNVELLKEALTNVLYDPTGTLNQHFTNQIHFLLEKKTRNLYLDVLVAMANGARKIRDMAQATHGDEKGLSKRLEDLMGFDLIFKKGIFHMIDDRLFEFWLKHVYSRKEYALIDNIYDRAHEFRTFVENGIETYLIEYNKGILERLLDLFNRFDGELVEVENKVRKLPKFIKIEILKYGADRNYLACETLKKYWICKVKYDRVEETDVVDFIRRTGTQKSGNVRKILIHLKGVDTNALLLAKEKRIWVWDLKTVNLLLRLYKKQDLKI